MTNRTPHCHPGECRDLKPQKRRLNWLPEIPAFAGMTALLVCAFTLAACGVQRPLMRPKDIPAYEEKQRKKEQEIIEEQQQLDDIDAREAAEKAAADKAQEPQQ